MPEEYTLSYGGHLIVAIHAIKAKNKKGKVFDMLMRRGITRQRAVLIYKHASNIIKKDKKEKINYETRNIF